MVICPWCGTSHSTFQSHCKKCGGPLEAQDQSEPVSSTDGFLLPPPPPRSIPGSYMWRLLRVDPWASAAVILTLVGAVFGTVGVLLVLNTSPGSVLLAGVGFLLLGWGIFLTFRHYGKAQSTLKVMRQGQAIQGRITGLGQDYTMTINRRHPWAIVYRYQVGERDYEARIVTMTYPGEDFESGKSICVLYLPDAPERGVLFPHP